MKKSWNKTWEVTRLQFERLMNRFAGILFGREEDGKYYIRTYQRDWEADIEAAL